MARGGFHTENGFARILDKLIENNFIIIISFAFELRKRAHADNVAIGAHHGNGFQNVFRFVAVHYHAALGFEFPRALVDIEHDYVHSQIHSRFLRT